MTEGMFEAWKKGYSKIPPEYEKWWGQAKKSAWLYGGLEERPSSMPKIWVCVSCNFVWRQPRPKNFKVPICDNVSCGEFFSVTEIGWYETVLAIRAGFPGAKEALEGYANER